MALAKALPTEMEAAQGDKTPRSTSSWEPARGRSVPGDLRGAGRRFNALRGTDASVPARKSPDMELILAICMLNTPSTCREERVAVSTEATAPMQCMIGAQPIIAEWTQNHPKWKVERWRCGVAGRASVGI